MAKANTIEPVNHPETAPAQPRQPRISDGVLFYGPGDRNGTAIPATVYSIQGRKVLQLVVFRKTHVTFCDGARHVNDPDFESNRELEANSATWKFPEEA
jgi:hypothetical protein